MSIVRTVKRENPFVQIDNFVFEDLTISWAAKGVLGYILSKPNQWQVRKQDLIKKSQDGKAAIETALLELMAAGYMNWYQEKDKNGQFGDWVYLVYERPEFNPNLEECKSEGLRRIEERKNRNKKKNEKKKPKVDNPPSVNPTSDNLTADYPPFSNKDFSNKDFSNNNLEEEEEAYAKLSELVDLFDKNIAPINELVKGRLIVWLNLLPFEVIKREMENCALLNAKSWNYIEKALQEDKDKNIQTVIELENKILSHNKNKKTSSRGRKKPIRTEMTPAWMNENDKSIQEEKTPENIDEIAAKKREIEDRLKKYRKTN
jgi:DnaD/phage-associated family protein